MKSGQSKLKSPHVKKNYENETENVWTRNFFSFISLKISSKYSNIYNLKNKMKLES